MRDGPERAGRSQRLGGSWLIRSAAGVAWVSVALAGAWLAVGATAAFALTRAQANRIAMRALRPASQPGHVVLFGLPGPLRTGSVLLQSGPAPGGGASTQTVRRGLEQLTVTTVPHQPLAHRAWLFWEDLRPGADFAHPSVVLLVGDRSGRVVRRQTDWWQPLINGRLPSFLARRSAYYSARFRVFADDRILPASHHQADTRIAGLLARAAPWGELGRAAGDRMRAPSLVGPPDLHNSCMITIGDRTDPMFQGDFKLMGQVAAELHLDKADATGVTSLADLVNAKTAAGCRDVLIVISGHGTPARGTNVPDPRVLESDHARVLLSYSTGKDATGNDVIKGEYLDSVQLRGIMAAHPATSFKVVVDSCFSGRWVVDLEPRRNVRYIAAASRSDQMSFGWSPPVAPDGKYYDYQRGSQRKGAVTYTSKTLQDHTTNPTQASPFINGILRGLDEWAHNEQERAQTGNDLAKALAVAFSHQQDQNFAEQRGISLAIDDDLSSRPEPSICSTPGSTCAPDNASCSGGATCTGNHDVCTGSGTTCGPGTDDSCSADATCSGNNAVCSGTGTRCTGSGSTCSSGATCSSPDPCAKSYTTSNATLTVPAARNSQGEPSPPWSTTIPGSCQFYSGFGGIVYAWSAYLVTGTSTVISCHEDSRIGPPPGLPSCPGGNQAGTIGNGSVDPPVFVPFDGQASGPTWQVGVQVTGPSSGTGSGSVSAHVEIITGPP